MYVYAISTVMNFLMNDLNSKRSNFTLIFSIRVYWENETRTMNHCIRAVLMIRWSARIGLVAWEDMHTLNRWVAIIKTKNTLQRASDEQLSRYSMADGTQRVEQEEEKERRSRKKVGHEHEV